MQSESRFRSRFSWPLAIIFGLVGLILYFAFTPSAHALSDLFSLAIAPAILPSVGRKVWYYQDDKQAQPWDATIVYVHAEGAALSPNTPVNLFVVGPLGNTFTASDVVCLQDGAERAHYRWMPYQLVQTAKTQIDRDAQEARREELEEWEDGEEDEGDASNTNGQLNPEKGQFEKATAQRERDQAAARKAGEDAGAAAKIASERATAPAIPTKAPTPTKAQPVGAAIKKT